MTQVLCVGNGETHEFWEVRGSVEAAESPLLVHLPHSSTDIPAARRAELILSDQELKEELLRVTDHYTDRLFEAGQGLGVCFVNKLSRLVFDPERFRSDEREVMASRGVGAVYALTTAGSPLRTPQVLRHTREEILSRYYDPYAKALERLVDEVLDRFGRCFIVDAHSYPTAPFAWELRPEASRPPIAFGTDRVHTPEGLVAALERVSQAKGIETLRDMPFSGTYVPLKHLSCDDRVTSVMVEVRRDLYMNETTGAASPGFESTRALVEEFLRNVAEFSSESS